VKVVVDAPAVTKKPSDTAGSLSRPMVTVFGVWLGYEWNWIRQRHRFYDLESAPEVDRLPPNKAPGMLGLFGEPGHVVVAVEVGSIDVDKMTEVDRNRCSRAKALFPEAIIVTLDGNSSESGRF
jgi:hypothetical protein